LAKQKILIKVNALRKRRRKIMTMRATPAIALSLTLITSLTLIIITTPLLPSTKVLTRILAMIVAMVPKIEMLL